MTPTTAVEFSVVAHEFGHLVLGHYERNHLASKRMPPGGVEVDEFETARAQELEADRIGLELLLDYHKSRGFPLDNTRWAVGFWAGCLNVIELMYGGLSATHTSAGNLERGCCNSSPVKTEAPGTLKASAYNQQRFVVWIRRAEGGEMPFPV